MRIPVFSVSSRINQDLELLTRRFFEELEREGQIIPEFQEPSEIGHADPCIIYIASGGSEIQFAALMEQIEAEKIYLLTSGYSNSLAASMEILSYIRQHGRTGEIIHGSGKKCTQKLKDMAASEARKRIQGMKLGMVGEPSDWLIASRSDKEVLKERLGIEVVSISLDELIDEYEKHAYQKDCWTEKLEAMEFDHQELIKALELYGALDRLVERYGLGGLSVRCFDLLEKLKTTGCLGLAILNARGIYGGCEGDLPSLVSMVILGEVSGQAAFMCNPSRIDLEREEMVLAHCTLPLHMPDHMELKTHFESDIGVAIAGQIPEEEITIFKISGDLKEHYVDGGKILKNMQDPTLCRTQIKIKLSCYDYFLEHPISNHHVICCGDCRQALSYFLSLI